MEFTVRKLDILQEVGVTQGAVEKKTTIPILANLLLDAGSGEINLAATNLDLGIKSSCAAKVAEAGAVTTPAKNFLDILRSLPDEEVRIKKLENNWLRIECSSASFKLVGLPTDNFPTLPMFETALVEISARDLLGLINKTIFSVAEEEVRFALNGALLLVKPLSLTMVATDGHRLAHVERPANFEHLSTEISALIPKKALAELQRLLSEAGEKDTVSFGQDETHLFFQMGKRLLVSRMVAGQFPNYEAVLPKENHRSVVLDREELATAIRRVSLLADNKSHTVQLVLDDNKLEIRSSNAELGEARDELDADYSAGKIDIGFNCQYLLDFLAATEDPSVSIDFKDDESAGQLRPAGAEDYRYRYVVMPMRV